MDTWFTTEPMLIRILDAGLDVIGMVKQRYGYQGRFYTLPELGKFVRFDNSKNRNPLFRGRNDRTKNVFTAFKVDKFT